MTRQPDKSPNLIDLFRRTTVDTVDLVIAGGYIGDALALIPVPHRNGAIEMLKSYLDDAETEIPDAVKLIAATAVQSTDDPEFVFRFISTID